MLFVLLSFVPIGFATSLYFVVSPVVLFDFSVFFCKLFLCFYLLPSLVYLLIHFHNMGSVGVYMCVGVCMCAFCNVWVCVCVSFVMCGCVCVCVCVSFVMCGCVCFVIVWVCVCVGFVIVWVCVCVGFVMCGCVFCNSVSVCMCGCVCVL